MPNPYGAPECTVQDVAEKINSDENVLVLDVREQNEIARVSLPSEKVVVIPMSELARNGVAALPDAAQNQQREIVVMCHHGIRSAQVTVWLLKQGWKNVLSVAGGIDAYAKEVDSSIGFY